MDLDREATCHALGVAEFYGPHSPMTRCLDHPTMLKNASAWGTFSGVTAALLAANDFTGAPAVLVENAAEAAEEERGQRRKGVRANYCVKQINSLSRK